jgi:hypothetical protein
MVTRCAPTVTYYAPTVTSYAPTVTYYAPPVTSYAPTVTYYAPTVTSCAPTVTYYAPTVTSYDQRDPMKCLVPTTLPSVRIPVEGDPRVYGIEYSNFKRICQEGIANKTMMPPDDPLWISIDKKEQSLSTNFSFAMALPDGQKLHPITVLRMTQVNIELFRVFADEQETQSVFWAPHLEAAERVVAEALRRAQDGRLDESVRQRTAVEANKKVTEDLWKALENYAKLKNLKVRPIVKGPPSVSFTVETVPSGRTVELLLVGDYFLLYEHIKSKNREASDADIKASIAESPLWVSLPDGGRAQAYGVYYYRFREHGRTVPPPFSDWRRKSIISSQEDSIVFE